MPIIYVILSEAQNTLPLFGMIRSIAIESTIFSQSVHILVQALSAKEG